MGKGSLLVWALNNVKGILGIVFVVAFVLVVMVGRADAGKAVGTGVGLSGDAAAITVWSVPHFFDHFKDTKADLDKSDAKDKKGK